MPHGHVLPPRVAAKLSDGATKAKVAQRQNPYFSISRKKFELDSSIIGLSPLQPGLNGERLVRRRVPSC